MTITEHIARLREAIEAIDSTEEHRAAMRLRAKDSVNALESEIEWLREDLRSVRAAVVEVREGIDRVLTNVFPEKIT